MEKDDDIKGGGNSYDFGSRMYDSRLGRWLSIDQKRDLYHSVSPYVFVMNSPINYLDYNGNILVDPYGNIIYTTNGTPSTSPSVSVSTSVIKTNGNTTTTSDYNIVPVNQKVNLYANDGTKIPASMTVGFEVTKTITKKIINEDGTVTEKSETIIETKTYEQLDPASKKAIDETDPSYDCHGLTFTDGKFWIDDPDAALLIKHDGYAVGTENNSVFVTYSSTFDSDDGSLVNYDLGLVHSTPLNADGSVNSKRGKTEQVNGVTVSTEVKEYGGHQYIDGVEGTVKIKTEYYKHKQNKTVNVGTSGSNGMNNATGDAKFKKSLEKL
jgi:RHS repeat-associated protein